MTLRHHRLRRFAAALALAGAAIAPAAAATFTFDFANIPSIGEQGDDANAGFSFTLAPGALVTGWQWNATLTANDPSWLSEMGLFFGNSSGEGVLAWPAESSEHAGSITTSGHSDLLNQGLAFRLRDDGKLHLSFFEYYDDLPGADGVWKNGSLSFEFTPAVPEPGAWALMAAGLAVTAAAARRRSRRTG